MHFFKSGSSVVTSLSLSSRSVTSISSNKAWLVALAGAVTRITKDHQRITFLSCYFNKFSSLIESLSQRNVIILNHFDHLLISNHGYCTIYRLCSINNEIVHNYTIVLIEYARGNLRIRTRTHVFHNPIS